MEAMDTAENSVENSVSAFARGGISATVSPQASQTSPLPLRTGVGIPTTTETGTALRAALHAILLSISTISDDRGRPLSLISDCNSSGVL